MTNPANLHDRALADLRAIARTLAPGAEAGHHRAIVMVRKVRQAIEWLEDAERARVEEIAALLSENKRLRQTNLMPSITCTDCYIVDVDQEISS